MKTFPVSPLEGRTKKTLQDVTLPIASERLSFPVMHSLLVHSYSKIINTAFLYDFQF